MPATDDAKPREPIMARERAEAFSWHGCGRPKAVCQKWEPAGRRGCAADGQRANCSGVRKGEMHILARGGGGVRTGMVLILALVLMGGHCVGSESAMKLRRRLLQSEQRLQQQQQGTARGGGGMLWPQQQIQYTHLSQQQPMWYILFLPFPSAIAPRATPNAEE